MTDTPEKKRRGIGRVAFLARLDEFRKLIEAGWPITFIYEDHGKSIGLSYSQFARYIGKYIRTPPTRNRSEGKSGTDRVINLPPETLYEPPVTPQLPMSHLKSKSPPAVPKGPVVFRHDPNSGNTRDDLI